MAARAYILAGSESLLRHYRTPLLLRWILLVREFGAGEIRIVAEREALQGVKELLSMLNNLPVSVTECDGVLNLEPPEVVLVDSSFLVAPEAVRRILEAETGAVGVHRGRTVIAKIPVSESTAVRLDELDALKRAAPSVELDEVVEPRHRPACVPAREPGAEAALLKWAQKGVHLTSLINAPVENAIVRLVARSRLVTPNRVTILVNLLAIPAILMFLGGRFLEAAAFSYFIGVLDGVDGKLARVRGIATRLGGLEHSFDALYEQALYASFAVGLALRGWGFGALTLGLLFLVIDSFVRHIYNQFALITGIPLKRYSRFDRTFALVDGRRNTYLIYAVAFSALNRPFYALTTALAHALLTAAVYAVRAYQHLSQLDRESGARDALEYILSAPRSSR